MANSEIIRHTLKELLEFQQTIPDDIVDNVVKFLQSSCNVVQKIDKKSVNQIIEMIKNIDNDKIRYNSLTVSKITVETCIRNFNKGECIDIYLKLLKTSLATQNEILIELNNIIVYIGNIVLPHRKQNTYYNQLQYFLQKIVSLINSNKCSVKINEVLFENSESFKKTPLMKSPNSTFDLKELFTESFKK